MGMCATWRGCGDDDAVDVLVTFESNEPGFFGGHRRACYSLKGDSTFGDLRNAHIQSNGRFLSHRYHRPRTHAWLMKPCGSPEFRYPHHVSESDTLMRYANRVGAAVDNKWELRVTIY